MVNPDTASNQEQHIQPNVKTVIQVKAAELPIHCPVSGSSLWDSHPRIYIALEKQGGESKCPYCGTVFQLKP